MAEDLCTAIRSLTVIENATAGGISVVDERGAPEVQDHVSQVCLRVICTLLPRLSGLENFTYQGGSLPGELLHALKMLPRVKLHTSIVAMTCCEIRPASAGTNLDALRANHNLHTANVDVMYFDPASARGTMSSLKSLLLSCPNLRCLSLRVHQPAVGASGWGPTQDYCGLGLDESNRLPPLEQLIMSAYPFGQGRGDGGQGVVFNSRGYPTEGKEIDFWAEHFDWSQCKRLHTFHGGFAMKLMPKLSGLQDFHLHESIFNWDVSTFCSHIPASLRRLAAPTLKSLTLDGILRHASSLEELRLHQSNSSNRLTAVRSDWDYDALDVTSLQRIQEDCQVISNLSLDLARSSGDWPYAIFDVIASFPRLRRLEMWFYYCTNNPTRLSAVTSEAACHIFRYIRSQCPHGRLPSLQRLVLHGVAPPRRDIRRSSVNVSSDAFHTYTCQLAERDDQRAAGIVHVHAGLPQTPIPQLYGNPGTGTQRVGNKPKGRNLAGRIFSRVGRLSPMRN